MNSHRAYYGERSSEVSIVDTALALGSGRTTHASALAAMADIAAISGQSPGGSNLPANDEANGIYYFEAPEGLLLGMLFFGVGNDNTVGSMRLVGFRPVALARNPNGGEIHGAAANVPLYVPKHILDGDFILGGKTGVAGTAFGTTIRFADTFAVGTGTDDTLPPATHKKTPSSPDNSVVEVLTDNSGFAFYRLQLRVGANFGAAGSAATSVGAAVFGL